MLKSKCEVVQEDSHDLKEKFPGLSIPDDKPRAESLLVEMDDLPTEVSWYSIFVFSYIICADKSDTLQSSLLPIVVM